MNNNIKNEISMKYVNFNPKIHDANKIAELRYNVDFRTYDKLFSSKQKAVEALEKTLKKDSFIKVIYDGDDIIGILGAYTYDSQPKTHLTPFKLLIVDIWDHFVICDIKKDDLYIGELAVDENHRSKGYGTKIIKDVIAYAQKKGYKRVILDADFTNLKARALYERLGFKVYGKKSFLKRGMYNMEFKIS